MSSSEWRNLEIISKPIDDEALEHELFISHDGGQDVEFITKFENVQELMKLSVGDLFAEYLDNHL